MHLGKGDLVANLEKNCSATGNFTWTASKLAAILLALFCSQTLQRKNDVEKFEKFTSNTKHINRSLALEEITVYS